MGMGLMEGLDSINVLPDVLVGNIQWNMSNIDIGSRYQCAVCSVRLKNY
jgi:hypothetical protein